MQRIILFDGVCNFCNRTVNIIIKHDKEDQFKFAPSQSSFANEFIQKYGVNQKELSSVVLIEGDRFYTQSTAVIRIADQLCGWPKIFYYIKWIPKPVRDFFYDCIAKYRYRIFGKQAHCMLPDKNLQHKFIP